MYSIQISVFKDFCFQTGQHFAQSTLIISRPHSSSLSCMPILFRGNDSRLFVYKTIYFCHCRFEQMIKLALIVHQVIKTETSCTSCSLKFKKSCKFADPSGSISIRNLVFENLLNKYTVLFTSPYDARWIASNWIRSLIAEFTLGFLK